MDFTVSQFHSLLQSLKKNKKGLFLTVNDFFSGYIDDDNNIILLRHDVDRKPLNALILAQLEHDMGIRGTFYFRIVPASYNEKIIEAISGMGHEIGYHYEEMDLIFRKNKSRKLEEIVAPAYELFRNNLDKLRTLADVKTICMHGSPLSPFDNKYIWQKYNYRELGISGEPYFDINWNEFAYLTDTGRRWNGGNVSVRDKVLSKYKYDFKSTRDIINNVNSLPGKIMLTVHPERWNNDLFPWINQLLLQNLKNLIKRAYFIKK